MLLVVVMATWILVECIRHPMVERLGLWAQHAIEAGEPRLRVDERLVAVSGWWHPRDVMRRRRSPAAARVVAMSLLMDHMMCPVMKAVSKVIPGCLHSGLYWVWLSEVRSGDPRCPVSDRRQPLVAVRNGMPIAGQPMQVVILHHFLNFSIGSSWMHPVRVRMHQRVRVERVIPRNVMSRSCGGHDSHFQTDQVAATLQSFSGAKSVAAGGGQGSYNTPACSIGPHPLTDSQTSLLDSSLIGDLPLLASRELSAFG